MARWTHQLLAGAKSSATQTVPVDGSQSYGSKNTQRLFEPKRDWIDLPRRFRNWPRRKWTIQRLSGTLYLYRLRDAQIVATMSHPLNKNAADRNRILAIMILLLSRFGRCFEPELFMPNATTGVSDVKANTKICPRENQCSDGQWNGCLGHSEFCHNSDRR